MIYYHIFSKTRAGYINFALHFFQGSSWEYLICEQKMYTETPHEPHISRAQHNGYGTLHFSSVAQVNLQFPESCDKNITLIFLPSMLNLWYSVINPLDQPVTQ